MMMTFQIRLTDDWLMADHDYDPVHSCINIKLIVAQSTIQTVYEYIALYLMLFILSDLQLDVGCK